MASLLCLLSDRAVKEIKTTIKKNSREKIFFCVDKLPFSVHELQMSYKLLVQGKLADYNHPIELVILLCVIRFASIVSWMS